MPIPIVWQLYPDATGVFNTEQPDINNNTHIVASIFTYHPLVVVPLEPQGCLLEPLGGDPALAHGGQEDGFALVDLDGAVVVECDVLDDPHLDGEVHLLDHAHSHAQGEVHVLLGEHPRLLHALAPQQVAQPWDVVLDEVSHRVPLCLLMNLSSNESSLLYINASLGFFAFFMLWI